MRSEEQSGGTVRIALVTGNRHKLEEITRLARSRRIKFYMASVPKIEIQSDSLEEIALTSARHAFEIIKAPLAVDDSGLFVEALNGFPGPYSSYVYKTIGPEGVLRLLHGEENRRACFVTVAALILPPIEKVFRGTICGTIADRPRGDKGFGFDPIFIPQGERRTYAEMSLEEKNKTSHRSRAFTSLINFLERLYEAQ